MKLTFAVAIASATIMCFGPSAQAQVLTEGFEDVPGLFSAGWFRQNNSVPIGAVPVQPNQGSAFLGPAQAGTALSFAQFNFQAVAGDNTISVWMLTPSVALDNGTMISFYTRTVTGQGFPDRLQLRFSTTGASTNVGTLATDVGDFSNLLLDINPTYTLTYPETFTQFTGTISGLGGPTTGRVAFRYFVENGGPAGANSDNIGIDSLVVSAVPEPTSLVLMGVGALAFGLRRKLRRAQA